MADYENSKAQLDDLENQTRDQIRGAKRIALKQDIDRLESQAEILGDQIAAFEKEVEHKGNEADQVGRSTVNAQMMRAEVENVERILRGVAEERERLRVELKSPRRVDIKGDPNAPAAVPETETGDLRRYLVIVFGSLMAAFLPALGIVVWDLRHERVNSARDVSKRLKIPVIGTVPLIPPAIMRRLGDSTQRSKIWRLRFTEAIDGLAARLVRKADCDEARVVLVTSAMGGEGKTTLATQLAMSLARAHRSTVLVDFDLRQPTLDAAMELPLAPGICEALRGQGDVLGMVQPTRTEGVSVVTAGSWNRRVLAYLYKDVVGAIVEQLRGKFDFVIIDSSPLLPTVETRLLSQHVDAVVLSVFRDVSQGPKVLAAQELLEAFGVRSVEAVVTGEEEHVNKKNLVIQAAIFDEQDEPYEEVVPVEQAEDKALEQE